MTSATDLDEIMTSPVIGVAMQCGEQPGDFTISDAYLDFLVNAGASYRLIEPTTDERSLMNELDNVDGLLIPGGNDISYQLYGGVPCIGTICDVPVPVRDTAELFMVEAMLASDKPILGICRGMQIINVALGGNLRQIMPDTGLPHFANSPNGFVFHPVNIVDHTLLDDIIGEQTIEVNSSHHNRVDMVADELVVCATAPDGFVESIFHPDKRFCLGVQWHPERLIDTAAAQTIATAFVEACRG